MGFQNGQIKDETTETPNGVLTSASANYKNMAINSILTKPKEHNKLVLPPIDSSINSLSNSDIPNHYYNEQQYKPTDTNGSSSSPEYVNTSTNTVDPYQRSYVMQMNQTYIANYPYMQPTYNAAPHQMLPTGAPIHHSLQQYHPGAPGMDIANKRGRRFRRRYNQIVRKYSCSYPGCIKSYGSLNHLNTHIVTKKHGHRKSKADFQNTNNDRNKDINIKEQSISTGNQSQQQHQQQQQQQQNDYSSGNYWYGNYPPQQQLRASSTASMETSNSMNQRQTPSYMYYHQPYPTTAAAAVASAPLAPPPSVITQPLPHHSATQRYPTIPMYPSMGIQQVYQPPALVAVAGAGSSNDNLEPSGESQKDTNTAINQGLP
ncbi:uncharacterized protein SPAPADRAFT_62481 [Spathaspora passalidarum NRRL Y-27907]|uniref:C2H2-type domain-containing protein n=1 Tax=Spathaspora passalidarum (strain NRRL Y-27907 / 11-Y1) TaxID=619300 RepID=G3AS22_SPAPN|nr:uncharacterized protein SPAPADRAFT_62481 [Spathaspora passalidarum NRRL Y-27907]EGW31871.1 hypothetical protein SPAPADRAFT_62481 [Spathaspora passalidarum NRRL Y-27907]